jgi:hypothetical protein
VSQGFALTQEAILTAANQARSNDADFVVLILPFREQVYGASGLYPKFDKLNQALVEFCRQNDIPIIDLTAALREKVAAEPGLIYFSKDIHLNVRGNELVAELLSEALSGY